VFNTLKAVLVCG